MVSESSPNYRDWHRSLVTIWPSSICPSHLLFLIIIPDVLSSNFSEAARALASLFPLLLPSFVFIFKAQLNASSSRKPSWIYPLGSSHGLNTHNISTSCGFVLAALPAFLMSSDSVSSFKTAIFCLNRSLLYSQYLCQCLSSNKCLPIY